MPINNPLSETSDRGRILLARRPDRCRELVQLLHAADWQVDVKAPIWFAPPEDPQAVLRAVRTEVDGSEGVAEQFSPMPNGSSRRSNSRVAILAAAAAIVVMGVATMLQSSSGDEAAPPATEPATPTTQVLAPIPPTAQVAAFVDRLDAGDIVGAVDGEPALGRRPAQLA